MIMELLLDWIIPVGLALWLGYEEYYGFVLAETSWVWRGQGLFQESETCLHTREDTPLKYWGIMVLRAFLIAVCLVWPFTN